MIISLILLAILCTSGFSEVVPGNVEVEQHFQQQIEQLKSELADLRQQVAVGSAAPAAGAVYTRWGRKTCGKGSTLIYSGFAAGSFYTEGGGANYQCMPSNPDFGDKTVTSFYGSYLYGAEYQSGSGIFTSQTNNQNVPCARCHTYNRAALMMIPGKNTCPEGWNQEYDGYLMATGSSYRRSTFECVDAQPEHVIGGAGNTNGALFYFIRPRCEQSLHCPPYNNSKEILCVVCTR